MRFDFKSQIYLIKLHLHIRLSVHHTGMCKQTTRVKGPLFGERITCFQLTNIQVTAPVLTEPKLRRGPSLEEILGSKLNC